MLPKSKSSQKLAFFLGLTLILSSFLQIVIISAGSLHAGGGLYVFLLMWVPGISAMVTQLIFERSLKGLGWKPGKFKYLAMAYLVPLGYCLVVYGLTWLTGLGGVPNPQIIEELTLSYEGLSPTAATLLYSLFMGTVGVFTGLFSALGEEIGWRGLMIPEMAKIMPFSQVGLFSGLIWALWHMPLVLFSDYNLPGVPTWYSALMFLIIVLGISFIFAWLRLKSGSLWTAVLLHASHNVFVQAVFTPLTIQNEITPYIIDEFGCGLAIAAIVLAVIFWRKRYDLNIEEESPLPLK